MNITNRLTHYADDLGYLIASSISRKVLYVLRNGYETPTNISKVLKISLSNVSAKLKELNKRGLVVCINPERKKGRIYVITEKGELLLRKLPNGYKSDINLEYEE